MSREGKIVVANSVLEVLETNTNSSCQMTGKTEINDKQFHFKLI